MVLKKTLLPKKFKPGGGEQVLVRVGLLSAWHSASEASHLGETSKAPRVPGDRELGLRCQTINRLMN